jgi:hypothetical protein
VILFLTHSFFFSQGYEVLLCSDIHNEYIKNDGKCKNNTDYKHYAYSKNNTASYSGLTVGYHYFKVRLNKIDGYYGNMSENFTVTVLGELAIGKIVLIKGTVVKLKSELFQDCLPQEDFWNNTFSLFKYKIKPKKFCQLHILCNKILLNLTQGYLYIYTLQEVGLFLQNQYVRSWHFFDLLWPMSSYNKAWCEETTFLPREINLIYILLM